MYVREMFRSVQQVYENAVSVIVSHLIWCTKMHAFGIAHSLYGAPRYVIAGVHRLW